MAYLVGNLLMTFPVGRFQVFAVDRLDIQTEITNFELVEAVEHDLAKGAWRVVLNVDRLNNYQVVQKIMGAVWLGIEIVDNDTGWRFGGPCTFRERTYGQHSQVTQLELRGVDWMDLLDSYLVWPDGGLAVNWWLDNSAVRPQSTIATNGVEFHLGPSALAERQVPNLRVEVPDPPQGPDRDVASVGQALSDLLRPWFTDSLWTYRLAVHRDSANGNSELLFTTDERATAPTVVTPSLQTGIVVTERAASATWVVAMGGLTDDPGDPAEARYVDVEQITETGWQTRRRERFVNRPGAATLDQVRNEAESELSTAGPQQSITVPDFNLPGYGSTVKLGDFVQISYDRDEPAAVVPIASTRLLGTGDGWERTVSVGDDIPTTPAGITQAQINVLTKRLRNLEGFVQ